MVRRSMLAAGQHVRWVASRTCETRSSARGIVNAADCVFSPGSRRCISDNKIVKGKPARSAELHH